MFGRTDEQDMNAPQTDGMDEKFARMALRIFVGPRDMEWHNTANQLLDSGPDYGFPHHADGDTHPPQDIFEVAGRILGYCAGVVEWKPEV